jgi:hypothetical protein
MQRAGNKRWWWHPGGFHASACHRLQQALASGLINYLLPPCPGPADLSARRPGFHRY